MEVHHPHHPTHKKKIAEYFLEFFMLFLAVSLGFLAENIREERVVAHQTINVLTQLHEELKLDTIELNNVAYRHEQFDSATAFISYYVQQNKMEENKRDFYILNSYNFYRGGIFESKCVALDQLKFAGILKNVKDDTLRSLIEMYNYSLNSLASRTAREVNFMDKFCDELRLLPFDIYKTYNTVLADSNTIKGEVLKQVDVKCLNAKMHLVLVTTFVPEKIELKKFDTKRYLNLLFELNTIRNASQEKQHSLAKQRAVNLLKRLEQVYPAVLKIKNNYGSTSRTCFAWT